MITINYNKLINTALSCVFALAIFSTKGFSRTLPDGFIPFKIQGRAIDEMNREYVAVLEFEQIDNEDIGNNAPFRCDDPNALRIWAKGTLKLANKNRRIRGMCVSTNYVDIEIFAGEGYVVGKLNSQRGTITGRGDFDNGVFDIHLKPEMQHPSGQEVTKEYIDCASPDYQRMDCEPRARGKIIRVILIDNISSRICVEGFNWGYNSDSLWVDDGCRAEFKVDILLP